MTAPLQPESKSPSRRALLAGALGGIGVWAATAIGWVRRARADDEPIVVGGEYTSAVSVTSVTNQTNNATVLEGISTDGAGIAIRGRSTGGGGIGVDGSSDNVGVRGIGSGVGVSGYSAAPASGYGVSGYSEGWHGVHGASTTNVGVFGLSSSTGPSAAIVGHARHATGVQGVSQFDSDLPIAKPQTGVFGYANQNSTARGVWGHSPVGIGVYGQTSTGYAGYFYGKVFSTQFYELAEIATPGAPGTNKARLFVRDNGAGKTQLCVRFHTGSVRVLTTEP